MAGALASLSFLAVSCANSDNTAQDQSSITAGATPGVGQSGVKDDMSQKTVVGVAMDSKDHTTLVKAIKQGELVDALSNAGPFTVFAPTDAAFNQLPGGTLDDLMKSENKEKLRDILQYHVSVGVFRPDMLQNGQSIGQVNGGNISITKQGNDILINGKAKVLGTAQASNGLVYVIDQVLLPK